MTLKDYHPLVSVIIPNYNHAQYLDQRIQSVLNQTYQNFEVIMLDDCSTDNSLEVIDKYRSNPHISKIVVNEINSGNAFIQWDKGIHLAKGDLIWIAESDDYCELNLLEELIKGFYYKKGTVLSYSTSMIVNENGESRAQKQIFRNQYLRGVAFIRRYMAVKNLLWNASSAIFRKDVALSIPTAYQGFKAAGDYLFWIEIAERGRVSIINKQYNYFRRHDNSTTSKSEISGVQFDEVKQILDYLSSRGYLSRFRRKLAYTYNSIHASSIHFISDEVEEYVYNLWNVDSTISNTFYVKLFWTIEKIRDKFGIAI